jgi:hypothetical protein
LLNLRILIYVKINCTFTWINVKDNDAGPDDVPIKLCGIKKYPLASQTDYTDNSIYQIVNLNNFKGSVCDPCKKCDNKTHMLNLFNDSSSLLVSFVSLDNETACSYTQLIDNNSNNATIAVIFALNGPYDLSADSNVASVIVRKDLAGNLNVCLIFNSKCFFLIKYLKIKLKFDKAIFGKRKFDCSKISPIR